MFNILLLQFVVCSILRLSFGSFPRLENMTVTRGEDVHFRCPLPKDLSSKDHIIQWKKFRSTDDFQVLAINGKIPQSLSHFYRTELTNQTSSLQLFHVDRSDSTMFICEIFETQTILCQFNLIVLIKPEAPALTVSNRTDLEEHQPVTLTCSSTNGNPSPHYTWYRNGTLITPLNEQVTNEEHRSMFTWNVTRDDHLIHYQCEICNSALIKPIRLEQQLVVKYRPYVTILQGITKLSSDVIRIEEEQLNFTCLFDANPPPTSIYWITNGTTIVSRERSMYFPRLKAEQSGTYTCIVENVLGKANQSIYLDVQYAPRVRTQPSPLTANRSDSVTVRCAVNSNPPPYQIVWLKNNSEILRQTQTTDLRLERVERNHSGLYTCLAFNRFHDNRTSNGSSSIELIVQSRPIIETTYSKVAAEIGQPLTLKCRVTGQPTPIVYWKHQEKIMACDGIEKETCSLRFSKMTSADFGSYRCMAENLLGKEEWIYTVVSRGKPETPTDVEVSAITASSFRLRFIPAFDGGSGSQYFLLHVNDTNSSASFVQQELPPDTFEYTVHGLNESTLYRVRLQALNQYGASPWSSPITVRTTELIITSDDLPQLNVISYSPRETSLTFDYYPVSSRSKVLSEDQLCLNIRHSSDGKIYLQVPTCLPIDHRRVQWRIDQQYSYLKLSICSKKQRQICGLEIEMKEDLTNRNLTPIILGIAITTSFLLLAVIITITALCCRMRRTRSINNRRKLRIDDPDPDLKTMINQSRFQNPYLLYSHSNRRPSLYNFSLDDYHQQPQPYASSFSQPVDTVDQRPTTYRSGSNPSSESSCQTQNSHVLIASTDLTSKSPQKLFITHYGFPPIVSPLQSKASPSISFDQSSPSSSSDPSISGRLKKRSYEIMV